MSVEGIWQGLKRFENENQIDEGSFEISSMRAIKRTSRARGRQGVSRGRVLGHQAGADVSTLLGYVEARQQLYLPAYRWVLDHRLHNELEALRALAHNCPVLLLDYTVNSDVSDQRKPLSHAALIKAYLEHNWPGDGRDNAVAGT